MKFIIALRTFIASFAIVFLSISALPAAELTVPDNVTFERGLEYANPDEQHLQLNLARPKNANGLLPAVLCIHGGGFRAGPRFASSSRSVVLWPRP